MTAQEKDQLSAYLLGDLPEAERMQVEQQLQESPAWQQELANLRKVLGLLDQQEEMTPSHQGRDQFYQFLEMEARRHESFHYQKTSRTSWWIAAALALVVIGMGFGIAWRHYNRQQVQIERLSAEVVETRKLLLLAMLEDASASERIQAMNVSTQDFEQDQRIASALIDRLLKDQNDNVRLKAAESLGAFMDMEGVTEAVIQALELESSPEVQIMLIETLVEGKRREALPAFERLMEREDVPELVRGLAARGVEAMI